MIKLGVTDTLPRPALVNAVTEILETIVPGVSDGRVKLVAILVSFLIR